MAKIQESVITKVDGLSKDKIRDKKINVGDVNNPDYQYELVSEYLKNNYLVDDDTMIKIKDVLKDFQLSKGMKLSVDVDPISFN